LIWFYAETGRGQGTRTETGRARRRQVAPTVPRLRGWGQWARLDRTNWLSRNSARVCL
jgi:hypothetical protein